VDVFSELPSDVTFASFAEESSELLASLMLGANKGIRLVLTEIITE